MAESGASKPTWLLNDPDPGQVHFYFHAAPDVKLSPEAVKALEVLSRELHDESRSGEDAEALGFGKCNICKPECVDYSHKLCLSYDICKICDSNSRNP